MSNESKSWIKKHWKSLLGTITVVFVVFYVAVFASVWHDRNYESDFWPNFFKWTGIILGVALFVAWVIGWTSQNKRK